MPLRKPPFTPTTIKDILLTILALYDKHFFSLNATKLRIQTCLEKKKEKKERQGQVITSAFVHFSINKNNLINCFTVYSHFWSLR